MSINGGIDFTSSNSIYWYHPEFIIDHITPNFGPTKGGTHITIFGSNFIDKPEMICTFEQRTMNINIPSTYHTTSSVLFLNDSCIVCVSPPSIPPQNVHLSLSVKGAEMKQFINTNITYNYYDDIFIKKFDPSLGYSEGGYRVRIFGDSFINRGSAKCKFGNSVVRGIVVSSSIIECMAPEHPVGNYALEISLNGYDFTEKGFPFSFYQKHEVLSIYPVSGPATLSGTEVLVKGTHFVNSSSLICRFGNVEVPAYFYSTNEVRCCTPSIIREDELEWISLHNHLIRFDSNTNERLFPKAHFYPLYLSKLVDVEISVNSQDFSQSGLKFLYQSDISIRYVGSSEGPLSGGTPVFVRGTGFVNNTNLCCRFGDRIVSATFLNRNKILCFSPPQFKRVKDHELISRRKLSCGRDAGLSSHFLKAPQTNDTALIAVFIEFSNNGVDFTNFRHLFRYNHPDAGYYQPGKEKSTILNCPKGSYCHDGGRRTNYTLCPPGTYQMLESQSRCAR